LSPKNPPQWGLTSLITWAVLDPVMKVVITETRSSRVVETQASSSAFSHLHAAGRGFRA